MSEEILKALMQLFAIIVKQDEGVEANEIEYVQTFLKQQLSKDAVEEYLSLFYEHADISDDDTGSPKKEKQKTRVNESVRVLGICRKINKKLNQSQKVVVLVRLFELINADRKFSEQRMEIINTVAKVFKLESEEFKSIKSFVVENEAKNLDSSSILIVNDTGEKGEQTKHVATKALKGNLCILQVKSVELYFLKYTGTQELFLNGLGINNKRIYLFASGSSVKLPKGKPIYYSDIIANFLQDTTSVKLSYNVNNVSYRFATGDIGLRNVSLSEGQGKLIGIMGASGAGKTTLLNVLCGINSPTEGEVLINGISLHNEPKKVEGVIGYIPQDDLLIEELTVYQNLYFCAKQCFKGKTEEELKKLVDKTLQNLGLFERKNLKVGSPMNKMISGGQRKRLNIALELIREPSILFVDEPTSGLSSRDSENVMDLLRELTLKGKLIFVVIHQPSSDIYKMFDKMVILDTGGYLVYYGNPVEALVYFKTIDNQINSEVGECQTCGNVNPELIFNILEAQVVDEFGKYTGVRKVKPPQWEEYYRKELAEEKLKDIEENPPSTLDIPSWFNQFKIYFTRDFLSKISNTQYVVLTLFEAPLLGFILSYIIRYIADPNSSIYIFRENENIAPYIFMSIIVAIFLGLTVSAEEIFRDRKILKREAFLNLSRSSYLMSKIVILLAISAIQAGLFVIVGNNILGIYSNMFQYWLMLFSVFVGSNILGLNISATFNSAVTIYILIPLLIIPQMALGGAMFSFDKLNRKLGSVDKVPLIAEFMISRWSYEALMVHQYKNNPFERIFFEYDKQLSVSDFKTVHYIPELRKRISSIENFLISDSVTADGKKKAQNDLELITNELVKERSRLELRYNRLSAAYKQQKEELIREDIKVRGQAIQKVLKLPIEFISELNLKSIREDDEPLYEASDYIDEMMNYYSFTAMFFDEKIELIKMDFDENIPGEYHRLQNKYHNEYLTDIVLKVLEGDKLLEFRNHLIQNFHPIYLDPDHSNYFNFRSHFYAPQKYFMGRFFETYWFNIVIIWLVTFLLYITLYYEHLKKLINLFGRIKIPKFSIKRAK